MAFRQQTGYLKLPDTAFNYSAVSVSSVHQTQPIS